VPATHEDAWPREIFGLTGWVYIMMNRPNGTLYVGVTDDLAACEHRAGLVERGLYQAIRINAAGNCRTLR
jgi:hypothetical protein